MTNLIEFKRGLNSTRPNGNPGEPLFATDTNDFYIGTDLLHAPKRITVYQDTKESDDTIYAGQPLYINNSGHVQLAKAIFPYQQVVGLALNNTNPTFACNYQTSGIVTLTNWTNIIGTIDLAPNTTYFLDFNNFGKLITDPTNADYSVQVGFALDNNNLDITNRFIYKL